MTITLTESAQSEITEITLPTTKTVSPVRRLLRNWLPLIVLILILAVAWETIKLVGGQVTKIDTEILGQRMTVVRCIRHQHLGYPGNRGRRPCRAGALMSGDQDMDVTADLVCGADRIEDRRPDRAVVVFGDDQDGHQMTFASFLSLSTSSATVLTCLPAPRFGGSMTFSNFSRGETSTPRASGVSTSSGFFFAFMMFGKVT